MSLTPAEHAWQISGRSCAAPSGRPAWGRLPAVAKIPYTTCRVDRTLPQCHISRRGEMAEEGRCATRDLAHPQRFEVARMANGRKKNERAERARAYRELAKSIGEANVFPTASSIFDCLNMARTNENCAQSAVLLRAEAVREGAEEPLPDELSFRVVSQYLTKAARLYATAGSKCVQSGDLARAYGYYRRAREGLRRAVALHPPGTELLGDLHEYSHRTAILRQEHARKSLCRRRLSLGILRRER